MIVEIIPATHVLAARIAANARQADIDELWTQARSTPAESMRRGMRATANARVAVIDGEPACMFGVTPFSLLRGWGVPWMVGTTMLDRLSVQKILLRESRKVMAGMQARYGFLFNVVDQRNVVAQRWLAWLGFEFHDPMPFGHDGLPFLPFTWSRASV